MLGEKLFAESSLRIGYILCFVTALGFICSLTYNHGYFWSFDAGIRVLSIGDILTSYSLWVPGLGTLFFGYCLDLFLQRIEKTETAKIKRHKKLIKRLLSLPHIILIFALTVMLCADYIFNLNIRPLLVWFGLCYLWISLTGLLFAYKPFTKRTNKFLLSFFIYIPVVLSLMFTLGLDKSILDRKLFRPNANIYFLETGDVPLPTILLRHLERGLLAKEIDSKHFQLYLWDDISSIEILATSPTGNCGRKLGYYARNT